MSDIFNYFDADKTSDKSRTIYQFNVAQSEFDEMSGKPVASKKEQKFRMKKGCEGASLFMQFLVLFDRNFKASSRNKVGV